MSVDSSELKMIRESARAIASKFDLEYWRHADEGNYPWEFINAFAEAGWLGVMMPEEYGGMGLGLTEACMMLHEAAYVGGANGASALHFYIFPPGPIIRYGSEEMKKKYLPDLAAGKTLMCFGVTEPNCGVDTSRIRTRAERKPEGGWVINGQKVWITNAKNADRILLLARTSPRNDERPFDGMTLFFTEMNRDRISVKPIEKLGRNAIDTNELFIENLEVADEDVVGEVGKGFSYLLDGLNPERICVGIEQIGLGRRALDLATEYAKSRVVFDRPIGKNQAVQHPLADSWIRLTAAEMVTLDAARKYDAREPCGPQANAAKFLGSEAGFQACDRAMQVHGGFCYAKEYHVERLWREARLLKIAPVSQEMVLNFISQKVLDLPKSY